MPSYTLLTYLTVALPVIAAGCSKFMVSGTISSLLFLAAPQMPATRRRPRQTTAESLGSQSSRQVRRRATLAGRAAAVSSSLQLLKQGTSIEALADKKDTKNDALIKVGNCYSVNGHICTDQRQSGRVVDHPASIVIVPRTVIDPIADRNIPRFYFDFVPYSAFETRRRENNALLTDFLGRVQSSTGVIRRQGKTLLKITLIDQSGEDVVLTLWGGGGIALSFTTEDVVGKMLAVGSAKVTICLGRLQLESTDVTVMYIDPPLKNLNEISTSIQILPPRGVNVSMLQQMEAHAEIGSTLTDLRMKEPEECKNKLYKCKATLKQFDDKRGWFITKCSHPGCNKNLYEEVSDDESEETKAPSLICRGGHPVETPDYQYTVNAIIMDDTAILPVVIFNQAMAVALETSCKELVVDEAFSNAKKNTQGNAVIGGS
ncbi:hypothetical protein SSX86_030376 [Deinandra increscens subsp. villosa]|uniref:Replication protein A OB domain-containing protein n=1 Tax=Deinandra increscens subsp. villosa TaxID=3103831 RepID=A0AAP0GJR3_9ASTR